MRDVTTTTATKTATTPRTPERRALRCCKRVHVYALRAPPPPPRTQPAPPPPLPPPPTVAAAPDLATALVAFLAERE